MKDYQMQLSGFDLFIFWKNARKSYWEDLILKMKDYQMQLSGFDLFIFLENAHKSYWEDLILKMKAAERF